MWKANRYLLLGAVLGGVAWAAEDRAAPPLQLSWELGVSNVKSQRHTGNDVPTSEPELRLRIAWALGDSRGRRATTPGEKLTSAWLEVRVNGVPMPEPAPLMRGNGGALYARVEDLQRWRIEAPQRMPLVVKGTRYVALDAVPGLNYEVDETTQSVRMEASASTFSPTVIESRTRAFAQADAASGGWLNYDLQQRFGSRGGRFDGLLEIGAFNGFGFGTSSFLVRRADGEDRVVRLETAWTRDDPVNLRSLRLGDGVSRPGAWGRPVHYGGLRLGTDFSLRPDFVPFPLPTLQGEAVVPSTVELYVDNVLRQSRKVPYGPFTIPSAQVLSGSGQVRLVVRDALGRENVITQDYYVSTSLLQAGVEDYDYEAGLVREDFTAESNNYGRMFLTATRRVGLSERLTAEGRFELLRSQQTAGAAVTALWPDLGVLSAAGALSRGDRGTGGLVSLGFERQTRGASFGVRTTLASPQFAQLGGDGPYGTPLRSSVAHASLAYGAAGTFFVGYVEQTNRARQSNEILSAGYSVNLRGNCFLSAYALKSFGHDASGYGVGVALTYALGNNTTAGATIGRDGQGASSGVQLQRNLPYGSGFGYRLAATAGEYARQEASVHAQTDSGTYSLEASRIDATTGYRLGAAGGVALFGGGLHLSRRIDDSFALVRVGDYASVPIYLENQLVARSDASGVALLPHLLPYQRNSISIQPGDLPLEAQAETYRRDATPARRSGAVVDFKARAARGALLRIILEDGQPLPAGAFATVEGQAEEFPVAKRGEVYLTHLASSNRVSITWRQRACSFDVVMPADAKPLPVLGPFVCHGVAR